MIREVPRSFAPPLREADVLGFVGPLRGPWPTWLEPAPTLAGLAIAAVAFTVWWLVGTEPGVSDTRMGAWWRRLVGLVVGLGLIGGGARAAVDVEINGTTRQFVQLTALVRANLGTGCLYVNEDLSALYQSTRSCLPTRFVFPQHLALIAYQHALGIDQLAELRRVLDNRPTVIVISTDPDTETRPESRRLVEAALKRGYRLTGTVVVGATGYAVYAARAGRPGAAPGA